MYCSWREAVVDMEESRWPVHRYLEIKALLINVNIIFTFSANVKDFSVGLTLDWFCKWLFGGLFIINPVIWSECFSCLIKFFNLKKKKKVIFTITCSLQKYCAMSLKYWKFFFFFLSTKKWPITSLFFVHSTWSCLNNNEEF